MCCSLFLPSLNQDKGPWSSLPLTYVLTAVLSSCSSQSVTECGKQRATLGEGVLSKTSQAVSKGLTAVS